MARAYSASITTCTLSSTRFARGVNVNEVGERWFVIGGVLFFAASLFCGVDVDLSDLRRGLQFLSDVAIRRHKADHDGVTLGLKVVGEQGCGATNMLFSIDATPASRVIIQYCVGGQEILHAGRRRPIDANASILPWFERCESINGFRPKGFVPNEANHLP